MRGCGRLVATDQSRQARGGSPDAAMTVDTASPSGMLCTPMARVTSSPSLQPRRPENETPTPAPSPKAWAVMMPIMRISLRASAPRASWKPTSPKDCSHDCVAEMKATPAVRPSTTWRGNIRGIYGGSRWGGLIHSPPQRTRRWEGAGAGPGGGALKPLDPPAGRRRAGPRARGRSWRRA